MQADRSASSKPAKRSPNDGFSNVAGRKGQPGAQKPLGTQSAKSGPLSAATTTSSRCARSRPWTPWPRWARLPCDFLDQVWRRIINEVPGIARVTYDISGKPPATIEWE
jgi:hypothetical protein